MSDVNAEQLIAKRIVRELKNGMIVNLGIGIPTLITDYLPEGLNVCFQTENGLLGVGPSPDPDNVDPNIVNAGKLPVTETTGASYFNNAESFAMIRGGHIDLAVLGVLQVDQCGYIANWAIPGKTILGVGGAMDLLVGAKKVVAATLHTTKNGQPKLLKECTFPLTARRRIDMVVTQFAVFTFSDTGMVLKEISPKITIEELKKNTEAEFSISQNLKSLIV